MFNVIALTETWPFDHIMDNEILPANFTIYRKDRASKGGGVPLAPDYSVPSVLLPSPANLKVLTVKVSLLDLRHLYAPVFLLLSVL